MCINVGVGIAVKMSLGTFTFHIRGSGFESASTPQCQLPTDRDGTGAWEILIGFHS